MTTGQIGGIALLLTAVIAAGWYLWRRHRRRQMIVGLVQLRNSPKQVGAAWLNQILRETFDLPFNTESEDSVYFCVGENPSFLVRFNDLLFSVHNVPEPYFQLSDDELRKHVPELRMRKLLSEHNAWMSMDMMHVPPERKQEAYQIIGRFTAAVVDEETVGLYATELDRCVPYEPAQKELLCAEDPLEVFGAAVQVPVVESVDEEAMERAVEEARRRWPEFEKRFQQRANEEMYAVKFPFMENQETEHMWVQVEAIEGGIVKGRLDNDPVNISNVKSGDRIERLASELSDWAIQEPDGNLTGGFSIKLLMDQGKHRG